VKEPIREGAVPVLGAEDVLDLLGAKRGMAA
jgi:hypothetical protein